MLLIERIKCNRCKVNLTLDKYRMKRDDTYTKMCNECCEKRKKTTKKCEHDRRRSQCIECGGSEICEHKRRRSRCIECDGALICEHKRVRSTCIECKGSEVCDHNRIRSTCIECDGASICEHKRLRYQCIECDGASICEHKMRRSRCIECGGSEICEHKKQRSQCIECGGCSICEHDRVRSRCKECDFQGYLASIVRNQVYQALKNNKELSSKEYIGCDIDTLKTHIEEQFKDGMNWDNYGEWHIDHITPIKYEKPTLEEVIERLNYLNLQPLWADENIAKGNRFIG